MKKTNKINRRLVPRNGHVAAMLKISGGGVHTKSKKVLRMERKKDLRNSIYEDKIDQMPSEFV